MKKTAGKSGGMETPPAAEKARPLKIGHIGWLKQDEGPECTTVAWCDINARKLQDLAPKHPAIAMFTDYREMLRKADLDLVVISSPNFAHAEQAVAFLDAGKHVFLEKPIGINREECDRIENFRNGAYEFYHDSDAMRREFIRRCAAGQPPVQDPLDAWRSHMVCLAAKQSAREDFRRVKVDYTLPKGLK